MEPRASSWVLIFTPVLNKGRCPPNTQGLVRGSWVQWKPSQPLLWSSEGTTVSHARAPSTSQKPVTGIIFWGPHIQQ